MAAESRARDPSTTMSVLKLMRDPDVRSFLTLSNPDGYSIMELDMRDILTTYRACTYVMNTIDIGFYNNQGMRINVHSNRLGNAGEMPESYEVYNRVVFAGWYHAKLYYYRLIPDNSGQGLFRDQQDEFTNPDIVREYKQHIDIVAHDLDASMHIAKSGAN